MNANRNHKRNVEGRRPRSKVVVFLGDPTAAGPDAIASAAICEAYAELAKLEFALAKILGPDLYRLVSS